MPPHLHSPVSVRGPEDLAPGDHVCFLYQNEKECRQFLTPYLMRGLERNEKILYIADPREFRMIDGYLRDAGMDPGLLAASGRLLVSGYEQAYLAGGIFDPEAVIAWIASATERALQEGFHALRLAGEMTWVLRVVPGCERLMEYEARLNEFFPGSRCTAVCQYHRSRFHARTLLDVLMAHPMVATGHAVYENFYYLSPRELLGPDADRKKVDRWIRGLEEHQRHREKLKNQVQARTVELVEINEKLVGEIEEHRRTEQALKLDEARLEALLRLGGSKGEPPDRLAQIALEESVRLTRSEVGFLNFLSEDEKVCTRAVYTEKTLRRCGVPLNVSDFRIGECGVWSEACRQRRPVVVNDYQEAHPSKRGLPPGHLHLRSFMSIPVFEGDRIVAVAAVGNKEGPYDPGDVRQFRLLMDGMWTVLQCKGAENALRQSEKSARAVFNANMESVVLLDREGTVLDINKTAAARLGATVGQIIGTSAFDHLAPDVARTRRDRLNQVVREKRPLVFEDTRDGRVIDNSLCPVLDENGMVFQVAVHGWDVTERKHAEEALRRSEARLQSLSGRLLLAQEKERQRLSFELHDELGQALMVLKLRLRAAQRELTPEQDHLEASLEGSLRYIEEITERVRRLVRELSPGVLMDLGLGAAVDRLAQEAGRHTKIRVRTELDDVRGLLSRRTETALFRVFQEALTNALKHAGAGRISLTIKRRGHTLSCSVEDDGRGFETVMPPGGRKGVGMDAMEERIRMAGGRFRIESRKGAGTRVAFTVPLKKEER